MQPFSSHPPGPPDCSDTALHYSQAGALLQCFRKGLNGKENEANTGHTPEPSYRSASWFKYIINILGSEDVINIFYKCYHVPYHHLIYKPQFSTLYSNIISMLHISDSWLLWCFLIIIYF